MFNRTKGKGQRQFAKRMLGVLAGAALVLGASVSHAQISTTKHNLGTGGTGANHLTAGTAEICVFCHTPHASNTAVKAPLWNKPTNGGTYTLYDTSVSTTIDGQVDMKGVSLACLSCHDGSQAMDVMINAPGSGGYNAAGARLAGATWTAAVGATGVMPVTVANLGTDLSNDHPVGIQYCGGGWNAATATSSGAGGTCKDPDFHAPATGTIGGATAWWVDSSVGVTNTREKTDMILYARVPTATFTGGGAQATNYQPFVECASCHDPHSSNATFLRIPNAGSAVCLTCHNK
jgi:predicted CXXCH cytochrome family protein